MSMSTETTCWSPDGKSAKRSVLGRLTLAAAVLLSLTPLASAQVVEYFVASGTPSAMGESFEVGVAMSGNTIGPLDAYNLLITYDVTEFDSVTVSTPDLGETGFQFDLMSMGPASISGTIATRKAVAIYSGADGPNPNDGRFATVTFTRSTKVAANPTWSIGPGAEPPDESFMTGADSTPIPAPVTFIAPPPPAEPVAPQPANGASGVPPATSLSWSLSGSGPAEDFEVRIWEQGDPRPAAPTAITTSLSHTPPAILETYTNYRWDVTTRADSGTVTGGPWSFSTALNEDPVVVQYKITGDPTAPGSPVTLTASLDQNAIPIGGFAFSVFFDPAHLQYLPGTAVLTPEGDFDFVLEDVTVLGDRINIAAIGDENATGQDEGVLFRLGFETTATPGPVDATGIPVNLVVGDNPTVADNLIAQGSQSAPLHRVFERLASFEPLPLPITPVPADGAVEIPQTVQLEWDLDGEPVIGSSFEIFLWEADSAKPGTATHTSQDTTLNVSGLSPFTEYAWQVHHVAGSKRTEGAEWSFTTDVDPGTAVIGYTIFGNPNDAGSTLTLRATIEENDFDIGGFAFSIFFDQTEVFPSGSARLVPGSNFTGYDQFSTSNLAQRTNIAALIIDGSLTAATGHIFEMDFVTLQPLPLDGLGLPVNIVLDDNPDVADNLIRFGGGSEEIPRVFVRRAPVIEPILETVTIASTNPDPSLAREGDTITLTIQADMDITSPTVVMAGRAADVTGSGADYQATIDVQAGDPQGTVAFEISDYSSLLGVEGEAVTSTTDATSVLIDTLAPTVAIDEPTTATNQVTITGVPVTFSEPIIGLSADDFTSTGITIDSLSGSGASFLIDITLVGGEGEKTLQLPAGAVTDPAGNPSEASNLVSILLDTTPPTVVIDAPTSPVVETVLTGIPVLFSEPVFGLAEGSFQSSEITVDALNGSGADYTIDITLTGEDGAKTIWLPAGAVTDVAGNPNDASPIAVIYLQTTLPDPFETEIASWDDDLGGWDAVFVEAPVSPLEALAEAGQDNRVFATLPGTLPAANVTMGFTATGGIVDAGQDTLPFSVSPGNTGFASLRSPVGGVNLEAGTLYRVRTNWYSSDENTTAKVRIRFGNALVTGGVEFEYTRADFLLNDPPVLPTDSTNVDTVYLLAKDDGATEISYDIIAEGGLGQDLVVAGADIWAAPREGLGDPAVLINRGGNVPALASGEGPEPPAGEEAFDLSNPMIPGVTVDPVIVVAPNNLPASFNLSGDAISYLIPQQTSGDLKPGGLAASGSAPYQPANPVTLGLAAPAFGRFAFHAPNFTDAEGPGAFTAEDGKLYITDFYITTSTDNPVPDGTQPVQLRANTTIAAGKGWLTVFALGGDNPISAANEAKVYSVIANGQDGQAVITADFLAFRGQFLAPTGNPAQHYTVHRIVVNEYPEP